MEFEGLKGFSDQSRVWIYSAHRPLEPREVEQIRPLLSKFAAQWVSHNQQLKAWGDVLYNRLILLVVDESMAGASGCSIDSSVRFLKALGDQFGVDFFDRFIFGYEAGGALEFASRDTFSKLYQDGVVNDHTIVLDNLVPDKSALETRWKIPLEESWVKRFV